MRRFAAVPVFILVLLSALLLSSCAAPLAALTPQLPVDPPSLGVTPIDTSAGMITVNAKIIEDQDATDGASVITIIFGSGAIEEDNYAIFDDRESVSCNHGATVVVLKNQPVYTFKVPQGEYTCSYSGNTQGIGPLDPVLLFSVVPRSQLTPHQVPSNGQYKVSYTPDSFDMATRGNCKISGEAIDSSGNDIHSSPAWSYQGVYTGTSMSNLSGNGEIKLSRTCHWSQDAQFFKYSLDYISQASVEVTWSH